MVHEPTVAAPESAPHEHLSAAEEDDLPLLRRAVRYQSWIVDAFSGALRGDVLEVGAGVGNLTRFIAPHASALVAVEPDPRLFVELARNKPSGVEARQARLEDLAAADDSARFDAIVIANVLEHLVDDREAVGHARALLRLGGTLSILVPAHRQLFGSLDRAYDHLRRYSIGELTYVLQSAGLSVEECRYLNPVGALGWLVAGRVLRQRRLTRFGIAVSDRVAVPIGRLVDRLGPSPFGQSVLAIATLSDGA